MTVTDRRTYLRTATMTVVASLSGCIGEESGDNGDKNTPLTTGAQTDTQKPTQAHSVTDIAAGPDKRLRFEPDAVRIRAGDTVVWTFKSDGHNVTSKPGASEKCETPDGAKPFASYEGDNHFKVVSKGRTYEHTFAVTGEYVYVCAPHADQGMIGTVTVEE